MAYPSPMPTFTDGDILAASQLNTIVDAVEWLAGLGVAPNPGIIQQTTTSTSTYADRNYLMRYTGDYIHVITNADDHGKLKVTIDGNVVIDITTLDDGYKDNVSSSLAGLGLTDNAFYDVLVQFTTASGTNRICWAGIVGSSGALI